MFKSALFFFFLLKTEYGFFFLGTKFLSGWSDDIMQETYNEIKCNKSPILYIHRAGLRRNAPKGNNFTRAPVP